MEMKRYSSYAEIEQDLEILKLEREVHYRKLVRSVQHTRQSLTPLNLLEGYLRSDAQGPAGIYERILRMIVPGLIRWFFNRKKRKC